MPYELTWEPRGVFRRYFGLVTAQQRLESLLEISAHPNFDSLRYAITDFRAVESLEDDPDANAEVVALHIGPLRTNPHIVMAAIAEDPRVVDMIAEFNAAKPFPQPYCVFRTEAEARQWIQAVRPRPAHGS